MKEIVFVGTGDFIGALLRYIASTWFSQFPRFGSTTFSAFGLESFELLKSGQLAMTLIYIMGSMVLGLSGIGLGILITR